MRKAERLFQIVTLLRGRRRAITAQRLAEMLEISVRTLYRDIQALQLSGVPIEGEAGVGYCLRRDYELPPLMFTADEMLALLLGADMVRAFTDPELASAARQVHDKIRAILPEKLLRRSEQLPYTVPTLGQQTEDATTHLLLRKACERRQWVTLRYRDVEGQVSERSICPLALVGWRHGWTLLAWCALRDDYRNFRLDRIVAANVETRYFTDQPHISLADYLRRFS